jgi:hypothetical protein
MNPSVGLGGSEKRKILLPLPEIKPRLLDPSAAQSRTIQSELLPLNVM